MGKVLRTINRTKMGGRLRIFLQDSLGKPKESKANCVQASTCNPELVSEKKMICMLKGGKEDWQNQALWYYLMLCFYILCYEILNPVNWKTRFWKKTNFNVYAYFSLVILAENMGKKRIA